MACHRYNFSVPIVFTEVSCYYFTFLANKKTSICAASESMWDCCITLPYTCILLSFLFCPLWSQCFMLFLLFLFSVFYSAVLLVFPSLLRIAASVTCGFCATGSPVIGLRLHLTRMDEMLLHCTPNTFNLV